MGVNDILDNRNSDIEMSNTEILARLERLQSAAREAEKPAPNQVETPETEVSEIVSDNQNLSEESSA
jgi:hypothetical protein